MFQSFFSVRCNHSCWKILLKTRTCGTCATSSLSRFRRQNHRWKSIEANLCRAARGQYLPQTFWLLTFRRNATLTAKIHRLYWSCCFFLFSFFSFFFSFYLLSIIYLFTTEAEKVRSAKMSSTWFLLEFSFQNRKRIINNKDSDWKRQTKFRWHLKMSSRNFDSAWEGRI